MYKRYKVLRKEKTLAPVQAHDAISSEICNLPWVMSLLIGSEGLKVTSIKFLCHHNHSLRPLPQWLNFRSNVWTLRENKRLIIRILRFYSWRLIKFEEIWSFASTLEISIFSFLNLLVETKSIFLFTGKVLRLEVPPLSFWCCYS